MVNEETQLPVEHIEDEYSVLSNYQRMRAAAIVRI